MAPEQCVPTLVSARDTIEAFIAEGCLPGVAMRSQD